MEEKEFSYQLVREGSDNILKIDYSKALNPPSIEDDEVCMSRTINLILESGNITKIIFNKNRDYEYDYSQVKILIELAHLYNVLSKNKDLTSFSLKYPELKKETLPRQAFLQRIIYNLIRKDPLFAYSELNREHREQLRIYEHHKFDLNSKTVVEQFIRFLEYMIHEFEKTTLINLAKPYLAGYKKNREIYKKIFRANIKPDFMFTKLMAQFPDDGEIIGQYSLGNTDITIFSLPGDVTYLYHIVPPEFKLTEDKYNLLDSAREILGEHKPKKSDFVNPELMREVFYNVGHDLMEELANKKGLSLRLKEIDELTEILVRYTVGFGLIEVLLNDKNIQDISINSPMGNIPMFIVHGEFGDCRTNIIPSPSDGESWATKLRLISGRPLDGANPILDTEIELPGARARIAVVAPPIKSS